MRSSSHVRLSIEIHICTPILKRGKAAIVDYIDHDEALTFMAIKWMEGGTLEQQRQKKPSTHREVEMIVHDALDALAYIHPKALESLPNDTNGGILDLTNFLRARLAPYDIKVLTVIHEVEGPGSGMGSDTSGSWH